MTRLFLDIETLPAEESFKSEIQRGILLPRGPKKKTEKVVTPESLTAEELDKQLRSTALSGDFGRILCVGYCKEPPVAGPVQVLHGSEPEMLKEFWEIARDVELFIGHNIMDFDLRFIYKRSIIHRIKPSKELSFARYRSQPIYDIMREWERWDTQSFTALDKMAKVLGLESSKQGLSGEKVYDFFLAGKIDSILEYCKADVELTRKIYKRMIFES